MHAIELRSVSKSYGAFTLGPLDLTLPNGCILGLVGENGAGKTTTIKLILDMVRKDRGEIRVLGRDNQTESRLLKEEIGVVLDEVGLSGCLTPREVGRIMAGVFRNWDKEAFDGYLSRFALPPNQRFQEFSRGMKMKLGIAVALSHHPKLLLLDEATSGLDPVVRDEVVELFGEFTRQEDHAVLLSSHIVSDLEKICDYIAFLHKGRLVLCEEKDRLKERYGMLRCASSTLDELESGAVLARRDSPYGAQAIVEREKVPAGFTLEPVDLESLFIAMVREVR